MSVYIDDGEIFNPNDVVSLFTNSPIEKCLDIKGRLDADNTHKGTCIYI